MKKASLVVSLSLISLLALLAVLPARINPDLWLYDKLIGIDRDETKAEQWFYNTSLMKSFEVTTADYVRVPDANDPHLSDVDPN